MTLILLSCAVMETVILVKSGVKLGRTRMGLGTDSLGVAVWPIGIGVLLYAFMRFAKKGE